MGLAALGMWVGLISTCPWPFLLLIFICFLLHLVKNWLLSNTGSGKHPDEEGTVMLKNFGITIATFCEVSANVGWASLGAMLGSIPKAASEVNHYYSTP
ncbi:hypothetical protein [Halomonas sp. TD01]|uniref:hypothetical protein n=1 Tax=Halomonas sp. TD01 TaxID=999141 RepID=UPI0011800409|nr:hypothetical protein [Halomonas sp. TD01]